MAKSYNNNYERSCYESLNPQILKMIQCQLSKIYLSRAIVIGSFVCDLLGLTLALLNDTEEYNIYMAPKKDWKMIFKIK
jgi:hypothetical protein